MIIQGKLGTYDVRWVEVLGSNEAEVLLFQDSLYKKFLFGFFKLKNKPNWKSIGRRARTSDQVRKYTPQQLTDWFWEVVIEYEQHVLAWNAELIANRIATNLAY
jgi:hypothetical protein